MIGAATGHKGGNVREVPADEFVATLAKHLETKRSITVPKWADLIKTGCQKEMVPTFQNWWFIRAAAIARQVYLHPETTVTQLRNHFGTNKDAGSCPHHFCKSGGKIIRVILRQLQEIGWLTAPDQGRCISPVGQKQLDQIAQEIKKRLTQ